MTQPPFGEPGGYYPPQQSGQSSYPQEYPQHHPQYPQYPQQSPQSPPPSFGSPPPYESAPGYGSQPPYAGQPPYGGQAPYSGQPQYGGQPWQGSPPPTGYPSFPETPPPRRTRSLWSIFGTIRTIGGLVVALGIIGFIVYAFFLGGGPEGVTDAIEDVGDDEVPGVGECITEESLAAEETTVVACDAPEAAWRTLGIDGQALDSEFRFDDTSEYCQEFPNTGTVLWIGELGGWGDIVCLEELNPEEPDVAS